MRTLNINIKENCKKNKKHFNYCVGGGRAYESLLAENQKHLKTVKDECGFRYFRFHGLLHDDMAVCILNKKGEIEYNWQYVDLLFDYLVDIGMKVFVEFSFMPYPLASGKETIFYWKANITMPKNLKDWFELIKALVNHWVDRYGANEVRTWLFEVWNEPNLKYFFASNNPFDDYMKLYDYTVRAVKSVDNSLKVGGPATADSEWIDEFIETCYRENIPVDFVSTHTYGVDGSFDEYGVQLTTLIANEKSITNDIISTYKRVKKSKIPDLPIHYTEWSTSYSSRDNVHDSYIEASFLLTRIKDSEEYVDSMSYWTMSDIFEEASPGPSHFHGGFGLQNIQGIKKPAFFVYKYLNMLGDIKIQCSDKSSFICKNENGVQILFWDYTILNQDCPNQDFFVKDLPSKYKQDIEIVISGLKEGKYKLNVYGVGYQMNDAYSEYLKMKFNGTMSRQQVNIIKNNCSGNSIHSEDIYIEENKEFKYIRKIRENDVVLITIDK
ncbi:MAG: beta-xylosidase [Clostridiaceae bacterium]